jgi:hypothetical protein
MAPLYVILEKLHLDIIPALKKENIKMGRDKFLNLQGEHLLVPKIKAIPYHY